jgi:hypothetical protein
MNTHLPRTSLVTSLSLVIVGLILCFPARSRVQAALPLERPSMLSMGAITSVTDQAKCQPGQAATDPLGDTSLTHIDVTSFDSQLFGERLQATFHLADVPDQLMFNRVGVPEGAREYAWEVYVDVDDDLETGSDVSASEKGAEYSLSAMHFVSEPDMPEARAIEQGVQVNTWEYVPERRSWRVLGSAVIVVNDTANTLILRGDIPEIHTDSRLIYQTYDRNPSGTPAQDTSPCRATARNMVYLPLVRR